MSWLDDEADSNSQKETADQHQRELIRQSNYWGAIVLKIEQDVQAINSHVYWKTKLAGFPLRFQQPYGGDGYQISKSGYPAILVKIQHKPGHILVAREFTENPLSKDFKRREKLNVGTLGNAVVLIAENGQETYIVPEDAAQYILKAVIESLKITKSS